ncbi:MAG: PH domain-containing protein [Thermoplasmata archaeon]
MERPPTREDFTYPKAFLMVRLSLVLVVVVLLLMLVAFFPLMGAWSVIFFIVLIFYLGVVGISPFFTDHWVTLTRLVLRQGLYFKVSIPYSEIESIETTNEVAKYGVRSSWVKGKVYIATSQHGLVSIKLRNPIRFLLILGKSATELIVSVDEPERFMRAIRERMELLAPIEPDRAYADFGD